MNTKWFGLAVAVTFVTGCEQKGDTSCERLAAEARGILEACGVTFHDYPDNLGTPCTDSVREVQECLLACYENASCEVILGDDEPAFEAFIACTVACGRSSD